MKNQLVKVENGLQVFENEKFGKVRVVMKGDEPWFVARDVCDCLELGNSREAISRLDEDEKNTVSLNDGTPGNPNIINPDVGGRGTLIISEPVATLGGAHQLTTQGVDTIRTLNDSNGLGAVK